MPNDHICDVCMRLRSAACGGDDRVREGVLLAALALTGVYALLNILF